jgi:hypothetical protein
MIFGKQSNFAVEAETLRQSGKWLFGHLRFWVAGNAIGDFEDTSDLAGSARWGRRFLAASRRRTRPALDGRDASDVYAFLFGRFFERGGSEPEEPFDRDPHVLDDIGESSVRDRVTLLAVRRGDGQDRIIVHDHRTGTTSETAVPATMCDTTIDGYCAWVEAQMVPRTHSASLSSPPPSRSPPPRR